MYCILVVDDSALIRRSLKSWIEQNGWKVCGEAENGLEGVAKAQQLNPDLILLDLSMPVMDGLQAATKLKQLMPKIPIIMFTNHSSNQLKRDAKEAGVDILRSKNEGIGLLMGSIEELLAA